MRKWAKMHLIISWQHLPLPPHSLIWPTHFLSNVLFNSTWSTRLLLHRHTIAQPFWPTCLHFSFSFSFSSSDSLLRLLNSTQLNLHALQSNAKPSECKWLVSGNWILLQLNRLTKLTNWPTNWAKPEPKFRQILKLAAMTFNGLLKFRFELADKKRKQFFSHSHSIANYCKAAKQLTTKNHFHFHLQMKLQFLHNARMSLLQMQPRNLA